MTQEMKEKLSEGYEFVNGMMAYEDPDYLVPFTDLETVREHIELYVRDWQEELPQCLRDPATLMAVWNDCFPTNNN